MPSDSPAPDRERCAPRGRGIGWVLGTLLPRLLAVLVLGVVGVELGLRVVEAVTGRHADVLPEPGYARLYRPHPYLTFELVPGAVRPGPFALKINSLGLRGEEITLAKPEGVVRIACLGGSTTFGTGVTSNEHTYPAMLERILNVLDRNRGRFQVLNFGVPGYATPESLINFELRVLEYEPDAVVVYHGANDARPIQAEGFRPDYSHYRRHWVDREVGGLERFLLEHSRIYARLAKASGEDAFTLVGRVHVDGYLELHRPASKGVNEAGVDAMLRNVDSIVTLARRHGVQPILSTFAYEQEPGDDLREIGDYAAAIDRINERLRAYAGAEDLPLVEVAEWMHGKRDELFVDVMHLDDDGSREHARLVAETMLDRGLFGLTR